MVDLMDEARRMPYASISFARGVSEVRTPEHLIPLRTRVRERHWSLLGSVHNVLYERFDRTSDDYLNVFRAAAEMAVMAEVGRDSITPQDYQVLRQLWVDLLNAR